MKYPSVWSCIKLIKIICQILTQFFTQRYVRKLNPSCAKFRIEFFFMKIISEIFVSFNKKYYFKKETK